jgi:hypothetical protein
MNEEKIASAVFNITLVLFSVSFAWMVNDRINNFPKIRRFNALCLCKIYHLIKFVFIKFICKIPIIKNKIACNKKLDANITIFWSSWSVIGISLVFAIHALIIYRIELTNIDLKCTMKLPPLLLIEDLQLFALIYVVPLLFFILPQFVSRLITSLAFWLAKDEVKRLWREDRHVFDTFTTGWKRAHGLTCEGIARETFVNKGRERSVWTIVSLIFFIYFPIYSIITRKIVETYILPILSTIIIVALIIFIMCLKDYLSNS